MNKATEACACFFSWKSHIFQCFQRHCHDIRLCLLCILRRSSPNSRTWRQWAPASIPSATATYLSHTGFWECLSWPWGQNMPSRHTLLINWWESCLPPPAPFLFLTVDFSVLVMYSPGRSTSPEGLRRWCWGDPEKPSGTGSCLLPRVGRPCSPRLNLRPSTPGTCRHRSVPTLQGSAAWLRGTCQSISPGGSVQTGTSWLVLSQLLPTERRLLLKMYQPEGDGGL